MSRIPWSPSSGIALVNYADDFFLLATSIPLLAAGGDMLIDAVSEIPGGTFKLKQLSEGSVHDGMAFLGHTFAFKSGALKTSPADADRKSTRLNSSHSCAPRMPSSACNNKLSTLPSSTCTHNISHR